MAAQIAIISSTRPIAERIYLDHAATTPLRPEAKAAMAEGFRLWANPSSPHAEGRKARALLEDARERIKVALGWDGELIFTSGASEAASLARGYVRAPGELISEVEHDAVLHPVFGARALYTPLGVGLDGAIRETDLVAGLLEEMVSEPDWAGRLVIVQHVNSETGAEQDLPGLGAIARSHGGILLTDCAQSAGKMPLPDAEMAIVSAHKFGGPIGVGALLVREFRFLDAPGGQERGYRRGTENLPGALGMAAALDACGEPYIDPVVLEPLDEFAGQVRAIGGTWLSDGLTRPTPYIRSLAMPGLGGSAQVMRFDMAGISVSQGSACSSGTMKPSRVLEAMGVDREIAQRTIRVSFGWNTKRAEVERFCEVWLEIARSHA